MAINLQKHQRIEISLQKVGVGLGWDPNESGNVEYDLDASAFLLGTDGKLVSDEHLVFYNKKLSPDGAVVGANDDRTGGTSDGDDEIITVDLTKVGSQVHSIVFTATIHDHAARRQNFGQVRNSFIRIFDQITGEEIAKYELDEDFSTETAIELGRLYRRDGGWKFEALGVGSNSGLEGLVDKYQR